MRFGRVGQDYTAAVILSYKEIDVLSCATINISVAEQSMERIKTMREKPESAIAVIGSVKEVVDTVIEIVDKVAEIHPIFELSWKAVTALYKLVSHQYENDTKLVSMVDQMRNAHEFTFVAKDLTDDANIIKPRLKDLLHETANCSQFVQEYVRFNFAARMARIRDRERIDRFAGRFTDLRKELDSRIGAAAAKVAGEIRQQQVLDARLMSEARNTVIDMSLVQQLEVLEKRLSPIKSDASDVSNRPRCLWLTGAAGSGKSTIAVTASDRIDKIGCGAAYLFFEREKNEPGSVIRTMAYRLAILHPSFASRLSDACEKNKNINGNTLKTQFEVLLLEPLKALEKEGREHTVIILDALDECGTTEQREELLSLLKNEFARLPSKVRVIVTSRPEFDIMNDLSSRSHIRQVLLEHKSDQSKCDVGRYIRETMSEILGESATKEEGWDDKMRVLCKAADGLFIWASTVVRIVKRSEVKWEQLDVLLEDIRSIGEYGIDGLYATALKDSGIMWRSPKSKDRFSKVVGLVVLAKEELSVPIIAELLALERDLVDITLGHLQPVVSFGPGRPVNLHHASFADYLLSADRSGGQPWHIDEADQRLAIAERCLEIMADMLRFNICSINSSFNYNKDIPDLQERIGKNVPAQLNYACRFWAVHVCELPYSTNLNLLLVKLKTFAEMHLLYWFEVLSLTENFNRIAIRALYEVSLWAAPIDPDLSSFLWEGYRLASVFAFPIAQSAPQIYLSAVSLWRGESRVADHYGGKQPCISVQRYGLKPPAQCIKVIRGHESYVVSVVFSPDGNRIASGSEDGMVCIWDADTGELVLVPLEGHTGTVNSIAFSIDGKLVVSGSSDNTIRIWSSVTGELVSGRLEGHKAHVYAVAFSRDGERVVSGSRDRTVRIWDVDTGKLVSGPFKGHRKSVCSVAFSPSGTHVVSGSSDNTIRVWDVDSGVLISGPFEGHTGWVTSAAFSADGSRIVSGSLDKTVRVWDSETGKLMSGPFEGHTDHIVSVTFSSDGNHIISGAGDYIVHVWDSRTGEVVSGPFEGHTNWVASVPFEGHTNWVASVPFSPDRKRAVSGSTDGTIRIWDVDGSAGPSGSHNEYESSMSAVGISANGKLAVSGYWDGTICVWDTHSGALISDNFQGHTRQIRSIALSADDRLAVSGSDDGTVRVWNTSGGEFTSGPLEGHKSFIWSVAFSQDGNRVVSGSADSTVRIWDTAGCELRVILGPLDGHTDSVRSVAFSPDGGLVVTCSDDRITRFWNAVNGELLADPFQEHNGDVKTLAFSPDGSRVVSGSGDGTIRIWNVATWEVALSPLKGHTGSVISAAFSPDEKRLVSGSIDKTIRVWDAVSGELISTFYGHEEDVLAVACSLDGSYIYSGSLDGTIRSWYVGDLEVKQESVSEHPDYQKTRAITDWKLTDDGWVKTEKGEVLTWVPEDMRFTLWQARNAILFGCQFSMRLDFSNAPVGQGWYKGFPR